MLCDCFINKKQQFWKVIQTDLKQLFFISNNTVCIIFNTLKYKYIFVGLRAVYQKD